MEIKTLQELQEYTAQEVGYSNWHSLLHEVKQDAELLDFYIDAIAIEFAKQFIDLAAEKDLIEYAPFSVWKENINNKDSEWELTDNGEAFRGNKQSILDIKQLIK